jgi:adenosylcobinamide hydrolase
MKNIDLTEKITLEITDQHIHILLSEPHQTLSSAVLNGGIFSATGILNMKVQQNINEQDYALPPEKMLLKYCQENNWSTDTVGLITAAEMGSLRIAKREIEGIEIFAMVTAGLSNALRAGDPAKFHCFESRLIPGTINTVILITAKMTDAALAECLIISTEAKALALQEAGVKSIVSNLPATGTGTDSTCIVSGNSNNVIKYCGKHTIIGELVANATIEAITSSISWSSKN